MTLKKLSIVIPVYNEAQGISMLYERIGKFLNELKSISHEVILVDDHSTDGTSSLLKGHCPDGSDYRYIRLSKNSGSHIAILAGLHHATGDCAVFMAADLQDPPELITQMLQEWEKGSRIIWAVRKKREGVSIFTKLFAGAFYFLFNRFADVKQPPAGADFALLDRMVYKSLLESAGSKPSLAALIAWLGYDDKQIFYTKEARKFGKSKWNMNRKINAFIDAFVGFSYKPLRLISITGIFMAIVGFLYAGIVIALKIIMNTQVEGWTSLMIVVLVIGGMQMLMTGILGEYLWRNLEESRKRPLFFVEENENLKPGRQ
jgi:polyisoprenyl-phosphate glycosyltransferase